MGGIVITLTEKRLNELEAKAPMIFDQLYRCRDDISELQKNSAQFSDLSSEIQKVHHALKKQKEEIAVKIESLREGFALCDKQLKKNADDLSFINSRLNTIDSQIAQIAAESSIIKQMIDRINADAKKEQGTLRETSKETRSATELLQILNTSLEKLKIEVNQVKSKAESLPVESIQKNIADIMQYLPNTKDKILNNDDINAKFKKIETTLANLVKNVIQGQMK